MRSLTERAAVRFGARSAVTVGLVSALALAACGSDGDSSGSESSGGTINLAIPQDPTSLDPHSVYGWGAAMWPLMYDTLVYINEDGEAEANLAESWEVQGSRAEFTLRDDVTCADGTPLTPSLVARNFKRLKDPEVAAGQSAFNTTEFKVAADDDAATVTLTFANPDPFLIEAVATIYIACGNGLKDPAAFDMGDGTGPFKMVEAKPDDRYRLEVRDEYAWGAGGTATDVAGFPDEVVVRVVADETTKANLMLSGELDIATFDGLEHTRIENTAEIESERVNAGNSLIAFKHNDGHPTAERAVRRALAAAIDPAEYAGVITGGLGTVPSGFATTEPKVCDYDVSAALPAADPTAAEQELDEAGWLMEDDGIRRRDGRELAVTLIGGTEYQNAFEFLQTQWQEIGVTTKLDLAAGSTLQGRLFEADDWDIAGITLESTTPTIFKPLLSGPAPGQGGQNFSRIDNQEYTSTSTDAMTATREEACELWAAAEEASFESADMVPLAQREVLWAHRTGISITPRSALGYDVMSLRRN